MKKNRKSLIKCWIITIIIFLILGFIVLHFVPCYIWNDFKTYKKSEFFGSYLGSAISALLALGGIALSLIINNYEAHKTLNEERANNLETELMITNYKTLNRLMIHLQRVNSDFHKASTSIEDILSNVDFSVNDVLFKIITGHGDAIKSIVRTQLSDNINHVENAIDEYHIFSHVYIDQLQRVFINTPYLHGHEEFTTSCLKELNENVHKTQVSFLNAIKSQNGKTQKIGIKEAHAHIQDVISGLSSLNENSLSFGTELEQYLRNKE